MRLGSLECIMPLPELEASEDFVAKRCNTTGPEVFTHRSPSGADGFEIVVRKKIFSSGKLYELVHGRQELSLINLVSRNGDDGFGNRARRRPGISEVR
jgi:hypothetical protein